MVSWIFFSFLGVKIVPFFLVDLTSLFYKNVLGTSGLVRSVVFFCRCWCFVCVCVDDWMANDY